jgi:hypothetical protein
LKRSLGQHVVSLFSTGACGDINHLDVAKKRQRTADEIGNILAGEVLKTRERIRTAEHFPISAASRFLKAKARLPGEDDVERAKQLLARAEQHPDSGIKPADRFFARQCMILHEYKEDAVDIEVQVLRFGEWAVVGVPCELFVEFGLSIKGKSPCPFTMIATFANGANGYVATREAFRQGGYEARLTSRSRLLPDAGYEMVKTALEFLNELKM